VSWSRHCVIMRSASSRKVTTIRNRPIAGMYLLGPPSARIHVESRALHQPRNNVQSRGRLTASAVPTSCPECPQSCLFAPSAGQVDSDRSSSRRCAQHYRKGSGCPDGSQRCRVFAPWRSKGVREKGSRGAEERRFKHEFGGFDGLKLFHG
jgi:hypothetical protein